MAGDRRVLLANSLYHLTNDAAVTVLAGQIVVLQAIFRLSVAEVGILGGTSLLVTAVFHFVIGTLSDRRDPGRFLPVGIAILGVGSLALILASSFPILVAIVALSRIGASFYHPVGIAWIGREFEGRSLDRSMGFQSAFGDAGVILGMGTGAVLAVAYGWQSPFVLWGVLNLVAVAVGLYLVRGRTRAPTTPRLPASEYLQVVREVGPWLLPLALIGAVFNVLSYFGPLLLHAKFGFAEDASGVAVALWILAGTVAAFFFGRVSGRFGRRRVLVASFLGLAVAGAIGGLVDHAAVVLLVLWTIGSSLFLTYPALFSFVAESSRRQLQGAAFGVIFSFQWLGGAIGLFVAGSLAQAWGTTPSLEASIPFLFASGCALAGALFLLRSTRAGTSPSRSTEPAVPPL